MRALITGITGFVGSHLAEYLLTQGIEVSGTTQHVEYESKDAIIASGLIEKISVYPGMQIEIAENVNEVIKDSQFDYIFHLAATESMPPVDTFDTNVIGTTNLLEAVRKSEMHPVIVIAGCGEMYGCPPLKVMVRKLLHEDVEFELPVSEGRALNPLSLYGVSKAAQDMLGFHYHKEYGMKIVRARLFDISGPGDRKSTPSDIARQIVGIEKGKSEPVVKLGSLEIERDFTDVRDIVKALWLAATRCKYGEAYNICSGKARSVQQTIDVMRMQSTAQFEVTEDKSLLHPSDIPVLQGDHTKFSKQTGWKPGKLFVQTTGDLLDYWRGMV